MVRKFRATGLLALAVVGLAVPAAASPGAGSGVLAGKVTGPADALSAARVYTYDLTEFSLRKVTTDGRGEFNFNALPAGLYKIIAYKSGFLPAVVLLTRASAEARQFLEVQLAEEAADASHARDFWSVREEVPPDVLRDLQAGEAARPRADSARSASAANFSTEMLAMRGVDQLADLGQAQVTSGRVGLHGNLGGLRVGLLGDFHQLDSAAFTAAPNGVPSGQASALSLRLEGGGDQVSLSSLNSHLEAPGGGGPPIDLEHYRVSWSRPMGEGGHSSFQAQYTSENNFYRKGWINPLVVPDASQTWRVEGTYSTRIGESSTMETGVRYRERSGQFIRRGRFLVEDAPDQRMDLFGRGSWRVEPALVVEYGLYTTLRDGGISLAPRGGLVLQLPHSWQATATVSHRLHSQSDLLPPTFLPAFFNEGDEGIEQAEQYRYQLALSHNSSECNSFSISALDRRFDENLRLYFSPEFFDHLENLYLVPGDRLPELSLSLARRITAHLQARIDSSFAQGGGGIFLATNRRAYQNGLKYLVTSLTTRFSPTATGVFVALRRVEQDLTPLRPGHRREIPSAQMDTLELKLTQDLNVLFDLAATWVLHLNMEMTRGDSPYVAANADEIRRRFLAGLAVRF